MEIAEALERAIAAHAKWKYRLMEAIDTGQSEWRIETVRTDDECEFGKWLGNLPLSLRLSSDVQQVRELHGEFHMLASNVLELALSGQREEAAAAIAMGSRFAAVSSQLTMAVLHWKETSGGGGDAES